MRKLIHDLIPHAPQIGLYVDPNIPDDKLRAALDDYASGLNAEDVLALYDATLLGNGRDGAVFTADRMVFQNNNLEPVHHVRYADIVGVERRRKLISGRRVVLTVNRGRATFDIEIDFSGKPKASDFVARFLREAMTAGEGKHGASFRGDVEAAATESTAEPTTDSTAEPAKESTAESTTDVARVRAALERLKAEGSLSERDFRAIMDLLGEAPGDAGTPS